MKEISYTEWASFLDGFSRQHERWLVTIEVSPSGQPLQTEVREWALNGVTYDANSNAIIIDVIANGSEHLTHNVPKPRSLRVEQTEEGADEFIEITSADGSTTTVRFRSAMLPEALNGF